MGKLTRPRFLIMYALIPFVFLLSYSSERQFFLGVPVTCLGLMIRLWANGYVGHQKVNTSGQGQRKTGRLITGGPYAHVRHPLYFGTFLIAMGTGVIVGRPLLVLLSAAVLAMIYRRKMEEEEQTLQQECGEAFTAYKRAVSPWIPRIIPYAARSGQWSWQGIVASKEWKTVIWVVVLLIALYLRQELWQERVSIAAGNPLQLAVCAIVAAALAATDGVIELLRLRAKRLARQPGRA